MYSVFAMKNGQPIHRQSIIVKTFASASLIKGYFWQNGQEYYEGLGYTLAVCLVSGEFGDPVMYGDSFEVTKEIPIY